MNKLTDIEVQLLLDEMNQKLSLNLGMVGVMSEVVIEYYKVYKETDDIAEKDVAGMAVLSGLKQYGF